MPHCRSAIETNRCQRVILWNRKQVRNLLKFHSRKWMGSVQSLDLHNFSIISHGLYTFHLVLQFHELTRFIPFVLFQIILLWDSSYYTIIIHFNVFMSQQWHSACVPLFDWRWCSAVWHTNIEANGKRVTENGNNRWHFESYFSIWWLSQWRGVTVSCQHYQIFITIFQHTFATPISLCLAAYLPITRRSFKFSLSVMCFCHIAAAFFIIVCSYRRPIHAYSSTYSCILKFGT